MKNPVKLNTLFMGTSSFAATILKSLIDNDYNIISVYTRADAKIGREHITQKSPVKLVAEKVKLNVFEPQKFDAEEISKIKKQKPDLIIVAAYGKILPKAVLDIPGFGAINAHASLLPKFRGPSPVQNALLDGEIKTGTTIMLMDEGIDTGDILAQKKIIINPEEKYPELLEKMATASSQLLLKTLPDLINRKIKPVPQEETQASYCQLIERQDGKIIWNEEAISIFNRWRAFYPWPGVFTYWGKNSCNIRLILHKIKFSTRKINPDFSQGQVFESDGEIGVFANQGSIILEEVQLEGKNRIGIADFINGHPDFIGSILK